MQDDMFYNPLAHDEQILAEKLGMYDYAPRKQKSAQNSSDINTELKMALLTEELQNNKKKLANALRRKDINSESEDSEEESDYKRTKHSKREAFSPSPRCNCGCQKPTEQESILENPRVLLFLVAVLFVFCIMQYFTHKSEMAEVMQVLCNMVQKPNGTAATQ